MTEQRGHTCLHERDWGSVTTNINNICKDSAETKQAVADIKEFLLGNGGDGITQKLARQGAQIKVQWGLMATMFIAIITKIINLW